MPAFRQHIFICGNTRPTAHPRGCCDPTGSAELREAFKKELKRVGAGPLVRANGAGCLDQCEHGPVVVMYPEGIWYGNVTIADVPRIVEKTVIAGEVVEDLVIADACLNNPACPHRAGV